MKYLRTKTNIYEMVADFDKTYIVKCRTKSKKGKERLLSKSEVIKEADTTEELCDEFVVFDKENPNGKLLYYKGFENRKKEFIDFEADKEKVVIFGAIWTDKGLIYVAKMNDKGELELL